MTRELLAYAAAYRMEEVRHGDFYRRLKTWGIQSGLSLNAYPAFRDYLDYVLAADRLDAARLFHELNTLEDEAYRRLAQTDDERRLVAEDKRLDLTGKLVDFALTPQEWEAYGRLASKGDDDLSWLDSLLAESPITKH